MKASVRHEYGSPDVLCVEEIPKPTPQKGEVLVRVRAASVNLGDWELPFLMADSKREDLLHMLELMESGTVRPIVDRTFPLSEVPSALRYMGEGQALGKVIITM